MSLYQSLLYVRVSLFQNGKQNIFKDAPHFT